MGEFQGRKVGRIDMSGEKTSLERGERLRPPAPKLLLHVNFHQGDVQQGAQERTTGFSRVENKKASIQRLI